MDIDGCALPEDRLYDLDHDVWWAPIAGHAAARIGLIGPLVAFAGRIQHVTFRPVDGPLARHRSVATVESLRYTGPVRLPVDGTVVGRNAALLERPRLLNDAPYSDGWIAEIRPLRAEDPDRLLLPADAIAGRLRERIRQERIHCWPATPDLELYEIGRECSAILTNLNEELARRTAGEAVLVVTDDPTSPIEMVRWSDETGHALLAHRKEEGIYQFLVRKERDPHPRRRRG